MAYYNYRLIAKMEYWVACNIQYITNIITTYMQLIQLMEEPPEFDYDIFEFLFLQTF